MKKYFSQTALKFSIFLLMSLSNSAYALPIQHSLKAYTCAAENLTANDIVGKKYEDKFYNGQQSNFVVENTTCTHWVYMEINNPNLDSYIINSAIFYHDVTAYFYAENMQFIDSITTGYNIIVERKQIQIASNAIAVPIARKIKCYIKFKTYIPTGIDFSLYKNVDFINIKATELTVNGIVNGIFFLAIIYSALFSLLLWKRLYVFYMIYVVSFWVFMLSINYETPLYFSWLHLPFGLGFYIIPHNILTIALILYTRELLQLKALLPVFNKIIIYILAVLILLLIIYLATGWSWEDNTINKIALLPSYTAAIVLIIKKHRLAWFVFLGISLIYIAFLSLSLGLGQYIPLFFTFSVYGVMEIILFGVSITYWLKTLVKENEKALQFTLASASEITKIKENQNTILEQQVAIKTQELKIANEKLNNYIKQVENLNHLLETDNDKLKIKVIDQIKARSDDKIMNFEDFKINFPDEESCYNYIENIKWVNGFVCRKCGNSKYSDRKIANNTPARRCTKCGFVNTVSSYTLYHNIKFPLQKAFYITYMVGTNKSKTLEELSKELDLRPGTIHGFLKKVKEVSNSFSAKKKHKDGWTHLIGFTNSPTTNEKNQKI